MRVPLIATLDASCSEIRPFPALDGVARIPFSEKDGEPTVFQVDTVECRDFLQTENSEISFWLEGVPSGSWSVFVTDQRVVVHNRYSKGLIGKAKEKREKASAGHLYYGSLSNLVTFISEGVPILLICCCRNDGTRTSFTIKSRDLATMKMLAVELYDRIDRWIIAQGRKLSGTDSNEMHIEALKKWKEFNDNVWIGNNEFSVFVPCNSWDQVPDSRVY